LAMVFTGATRQELRRGLDVHRIAALKREVARPLDLDLTGARTRALCIELHDQPVALLKRNCTVFDAPSPIRTAPSAVVVNAVGAGPGLRRYPGRGSCAAVAGEQKARQGRVATTDRAL